MRKPLLLLAAVAAVTVPLASCEPFEGQACTTIGCDDGAQLVVVDGTGAAITTFSGVATLEGGATIDFACPATGDAPPERCVGGLWLDARDGRPEHVTLTATAPGGGIIGASVDLRGSYEDVYANGPDCGVTCVQSSRTVTLVP